MPAQAPNANDTRAIILAQKDEDWLETQLTVLDQEYHGSLKDPALKLWMVAQRNGIEVAEIKMESTSMGTPVALAELTEAVAREEGEKGDKDRTFYQVEGTVMGIKEGETSTKKPKLEFNLVDPSGRRTVTCYASAIDMFRQAKVKEGEYVRLPQVSILSKQFDPDRRNPQGKFWWTISLPPFGTVVRLEKDMTEVFKDIEVDGWKKDDPVWAQGILTFIQERTNDVCSICNRWVKEKDEENEHAECEGMEVVEKKSYEATMVTGNGQYVKLKFNGEKRPSIKEKRDMVKIFGFMSERGALIVHKVVVVAGPSLKSAPVAKDAPAAPKPKAAAKPAPKPVAKAPEPPQDEEVPEEAPEEAPEPVVVPKAPKPATNGLAKAAAERKAALAAFQAQQAAEAAAEQPEEESDEGVDEAYDVNEPAAEQIEVRKAVKAPSPPATPPKAASSPPRPAAPSVAPKAPAAQKAVLVAPKPVQAAESGEDLADLISLTEKNCKRFGNLRTMILVNMAVSAKSIIPLDGESEDDHRQRTRACVDLMVEQGIVQWTNEKKEALKWVSS